MRQCQTAQEIEFIATCSDTHWATNGLKCRTLLVNDMKPKLNEWGIRTVFKPDSVFSETCISIRIGHCWLVTAGFLDKQTVPVGINTVISSVSHLFGLLLLKYVTEARKSTQTYYTRVSGLTRFTKLNLSTAMSACIFIYLFLSLKSFQSRNVWKILLCLWCASIGNKWVTLNRPQHRTQTLTAANVALMCCT